MLSAVSSALYCSAGLETEKNTIPLAYGSTEMRWPGTIVDAVSRRVRLNAAPICHCFRSSHAHPPATPLVNQPARVAGNRMIEEAKIGGITPDMLSLNGRCEACPP